LRATLNLPVRTLSLGNALFPELERQYRTTRQNKHRPSPSFSVAFLDTPTQRDWKQLIAGLQAAKGQPFVPMQTTPGMHDRPVRWLCCDASGKERAAGAAAIFDPAKPHDVTLAVIPWTEGQWTGEGLSTLQEGFTASTAARLLMQHMPPNTDLIEALDSMSASFILRAGKASSTERSDAVAKGRQTLMADFKDLRIFTIHNKRERGTIPDALSNVFLPFEPPFGQASKGWGHRSWTGITWALWTMQGYGIQRVHWLLTAQVPEQAHVYIGWASASVFQRVKTRRTTISTTTVTGQGTVSLASIQSHLQGDFPDNTQPGICPWVVARQTQQSLDIAYILPTSAQTWGSLDTSKWTTAEPTQETAQIWRAIYRDSRPHTVSFSSPLISQTSSRQK
jgi:hypothetical protein